MELTQKQLKSITANMLLGGLCVLHSIPEGDKVLCGIGLAIILYQAYRICRNHNEMLRPKR